MTGQELALADEKMRTETVKLQVEIAEIIKDTQ